MSRRAATLRKSFSEQSPAHSFIGLSSASMRAEFGAIPEHFRIPRMDPFPPNLGSGGEMSRSAAGAPCRPAGTGQSLACCGTTSPAVSRSYAVQTYSTNDLEDSSHGPATGLFPVSGSPPRRPAHGPGVRLSIGNRAQRVATSGGDAVGAGTGVQRRPVAAPGGSLNVRGQAKGREPPLRARSGRHAAAGPRHGHSSPGPRCRALTSVNPPP